MRAEGSWQKRWFDRFYNDQPGWVDGTREFQALVSEVIGGRGGGRPEFAQGGGPLGDQMPRALEDVLQSIASSMTGEQVL